jgi:hypothetical protein
VDKPRQNRKVGERSPHHRYWLVPVSARHVPAVAGLRIFPVTSRRSVFHELF